MWGDPAIAFLTDVRSCGTESPPIASNERVSWNECPSDPPNTDFGPLPGDITIDLQQEYIRHKSREKDSAGRMISTARAAE